MPRATSRRTSSGLSRSTLDYVFWEYLKSGSAAPLFGLEDSVRKETMGGSFAELRALYDRTVWIDSRAEMKRWCVKCSRSSTEIQSAIGGHCCRVCTTAITSMCPGSMT
jgi:hypothetical protein